MQHTKCISCGYRTALITVVANIILAIIMGVGGVVGQSHALIADGFLAGADVIISLVVLFSLRLGEKEPDRDHPYGHGKVEFIAGSVVAVVIIFMILFLIKDAVDEINSPIILHPNFVALLVAMVSIFVSEELYRLNRCAGRELKSPALIANSVYSRFSAFTSVLVVVAILGAMAGIRFFDPAAVIIIGIVMIKTLIEFLGKAYAGLMDTGFPSDLKDRILAIVNEVQGVEEILSIKSRSMGRRFWVNLAIRIPASSTVAQSYKICETIKEAILFRVDNIEDVQIETRSADQAT
jgi:cation diffusion facilitator family transporter